MGGTTSYQLSTALKYELRDSWVGTDLNYCWSAATFKGCAWKPAARSSQICSYVNDTKALTNYPNAAPIGQTVYSQGNTNTSAATNQVFACPSDDRFIAITFTDTWTQPACLCKNSMITRPYSSSSVFTPIKRMSEAADGGVVMEAMAGTYSTCYTDYGKYATACDNSPFSDDAWNVISLNAQHPFAVGGVTVDSLYLLLAAVGVVAAALGIVVQRTLKKRREANQEQEDTSALYSLLDDDVANHRA